MGGGDTQVGGNGSVWWKVSHLDDAGTKKWLKSNGQTAAAAREGPAPKPGPDAVNVGDGVIGHDSTDVKDAGRRLGHPGWFVVTLRYQTMDDAKNAGPWVAEQVRPGNGGWLLSVRVPIINRETPDDNKPFEIRVEW
jgi:hypothetical protein